MAKLGKKNENILPPEVAGQMLQNIFDVCEVTPNTVPLEELESYNNYRKDRFKLQKILLVIVLLAFLAIPVMFISPKILAVEQTGFKSSPKYEMSVDCLLPITSVYATIDGEAVPVYETEPDVYTIEPTKAGKLVVTVYALNRQYTSAEVNVDSIDCDTPVLTDNRTSGGKLILTLEDEGSGINYKGIYATDKDGSSLYPESYDKDSGTVTFDFPASSVNIFVPDNNDNVLQLVMTVQ